MTKTTIPGAAKIKARDAAFTPMKRAFADASNPLKERVNEAKSVPVAPFALEERAPMPEPKPRVISGMVQEDAQSVPVQAGGYPKCGGTRRTGYAHYPGW